MRLFIDTRPGPARPGPAGPDRNRLVTRELEPIGTLKPWDPKSYWTYDASWANAGNVPFRLYKQNQHEGGIASPLIVHWPAGMKAKGNLRHAPSHLIDIAPTCLAAAGLPAKGMEGEGPALHVTSHPRERCLQSWGVVRIRVRISARAFARLWRGLGFLMTAHAHGLSDALARFKVSYGHACTQRQLE